jgi:hypothetical protein
MNNIKKSHIASIMTKIIRKKQNMDQRGLQLKTCMALML